MLAVHCVGTSSQDFPQNLLLGCGTAPCGSLEPMVDYVAEDAASEVGQVEYGNGGNVVVDVVW